MSLESVVRPFQNPPALFLARTIMPVTPDAGANPPDDCILDVTGTNPGQYVVIAQPAFSGFTADEDHIEDKTYRVTETVRIENPDDPDQYVMVDRLKSATFVNAATGDKYNLKFADWDKGRK